MQNLQTRLFVTRIEHNCAEYNQDGYAGPDVSSGIIRLPEGYDAFKALLKRERHLQLRIEDSHYECIDLFALSSYETPEVDNKELYDLLCAKEMEKEERGGYEYSLNLSTFFSCE
jgi:hypothetical protein